MELENMSVDELRLRVSQSYSLRAKTRMLDALDKMASRLKEAEANQAAMVEALEPFSAENFGQCLRLWNYEKLGTPDTGLIPIDATVKISVSVKSLRIAEQALSLASPRAKQMLAVVEAAKEISAKMRPDCPCLLCEAIRALK